MSQPQQGVADPYVASRSWGGHHSKDGSSTIDACRRSPEIDHRIHSILHGKPNGKGAS
jgi:hypothetical protein